jgi:hypothetical protein
VSEVSPEGFLIDGRPHEWKMGRMPASEEDWITEVRLRVKDAETQLRLWADQRDQLNSLTQQVSALTEKKSTARGRAKAAVVSSWSTPRNTRGN